MNGLHPPRQGAQRGAAALIVVLLLFFVMSLVAAYAGRNLIFEQKTSANQYRATQAFEAAEAGLEWALAMLNGGRVDAFCAASNLPANKTFRERYLVRAADGTYTPTTWADGTFERPSCVGTDAGWNCSCPTEVPPAPVVPAGGGIHPAFRVCFERVPPDPLLPAQPGVVRIVSTGRTSFVDQPCAQRGEGTAGDSAATVSVVVAISSGLATPPSAALTVHGDMNVSGAIELRNTDRATNGITASVGGIATISSYDNLTTLPGTPVAASIVDQSNDASLSSLSRQQMFASLFRMGSETYRMQPAVVRLEDCAVNCSAKLIEAVQANPGSMLWVDGDMTIDSNVTLGSALKPVLIVASGSIRFDAASVRIYGLVYSQADWDTDGASGVRIDGAAVTEGNFIGSGTPRIEYVPGILDSLRQETGSFVRIPGSWRDFP